MKVDWGTVLAVVIGMIIVSIVMGLLTKKKVDANTGEVKTKFVGFEGDKKDNMDGDDD
jgi:hypothetical protein